MKLNKALRHLGLFFGMAIAIGVTGCSSKKIAVVEDDGGIPSAVSADENLNGDSDSGTAMGLQTVHFPFDSFKLDSKAIGSLKNNISILKSNPSIFIQIAAHCDRKGGAQYNLALGEDRARSVRHYLIDAGISANRITVISYGKEKLLDHGMSEEADAKNRRANFLITSGR